MGLFRKSAAVAAAAFVLVGAEAAVAESHATLGVSYSAAGVVPGNTVDLIFGVYTSETLSVGMTNGAFTYVIPAGLTALSATGSPWWPATVNLTGNVLTVSGMTQTPSFVCQVVVSVRGDTLGDYPVAATTLSYTTTGPGSFVSETTGSLMVSYAPVVGSLSPSSGVIAGGETVVITGSEWALILMGAILAGMACVFAHRRPRAV